MTILEAHRFIQMLERDLDDCKRNVEYDRKRIEEAKASDREDDAKYYEEKIKEDEQDRKTIRQILDRFYGYNIHLNLE